MKVALLLIPTSVAIFGILFSLYHTGLDQKIDYDGLPQMKQDQLKKSSESQQINWKAIPIIEWTKDQQFAMKAVRNQTPVVLRNTMVTEWKAMGWNPSTLEKKLPHLKSVTKHDKPSIVYFEADAPMAKFNLPWLRAIETLESMTSAEFFGNASQKGSYCYWKDKISATSPLYDDILPHDILSVSKSPSYVGIWMGQKGVSANTHYDIEYNFYVQIYGEKRWTIWPPESHWDMYLSPRLGPNYRQSQVDFNAPIDLQKYPSFSQVGGYQTILRPGDVLYLPPLWFHKVDSIGPDDVIISVNAWTTVRTIMDLVSLQEPTLFLPMLGLDGTVDPKLRSILNLKDEAEMTKIVTQEYIHAFIESVLPEMRPEELLRLLWERRYEPLFDTWSVTIQCPGDIPKSISDQLRKEMKQRLSKAKRAYDDIASIGVKEIFTSNYIEDVLATTLPLDQVPSFLRDCLLPSSDY
eukprot:TRINITY_DN3400_c0_g1_i3.p1 TRINITY_DN3400_c0_g1~~TRINITY_DN3400_c0_g1_i3.p1  ORF type:complete len:465 (-),score=105.57 TRINITY_DN3400_c0_g1_i3:144-1538(-)